MQVLTDASILLHIKLPSTASSSHGGWYRNANKASCPTNKSSVLANRETTPWMLLDGDIGELGQAANQVQAVGIVKDFSSGYQVLLDTGSAL